ncbi:hypothetical protein [Desulfoscipio gibsoniae]
MSKINYLTKITSDNLEAFLKKFEGYLRETDRVIEDYDSDKYTSISLGKKIEFINDNIKDLEKLILRIS